MTPTLNGKISMAELRAFYPALAAVAETGLRNPLNPDEAAWLDGPSFARWLTQNGLEPQYKLGDTIARQVRRWREGDAVSLAIADKILTELGHSLQDLPESTWRDRPKHGRHPEATGETKAIILTELEAGTSIADLQERYGVPFQTLYAWASKARKRAA